MNQNVKYAAKISALGIYVPEKVVTNQDLEKIVDTSDEWIRTRTGILERRYVGPGECNSDLSANAVTSLLKARQIDPH